MFFYMESDKIPTSPVVQPMPNYNQANNMTLKNSSSISTYLLIALSLLVLASGVGAYLWRDSQANTQKNKDSVSMKTLAAEVAKVKSEAAIAAQLNVMTRGYGDIAKIVADAYNSDFGHYPILTTDFKTKDGIIALPAGVKPSIKDPSVANGYTTFKWEYSGSANAPTGGRITVWDYAKNKISDTIIYVGTATVKSTFTTPAL